MNDDTIASIFIAAVVVAFVAAIPWFFRYADWVLSTGCSA